MWSLIWWRSTSGGGLPYTGLGLYRQHSEGLAGLNLKKHCRSHPPGKLPLPHPPHEKAPLIDASSGITRMTPPVHGLKLYLQMPTPAEPIVCKEGRAKPLVMPLSPIKIPEPLVSQSPLYHEGTASPSVLPHPKYSPLPAIWPTTNPAVFQPRTDVPSEPGVSYGILHHQGSIAEAGYSIDPALMDKPMYLPASTQTLYQPLRQPQGSSHLQ